jgi:hypothetical protein
MNLASISLSAVLARTASVFLGRLLLVLACLAAAQAQAQHVYYRYVDEGGVKVLNSTIPSEYAQKGYEVLNASGQVVKVVPPAPSEEELARNAEERSIRERYAQLKRRYSASREILGAKKRRLANIDTNISILKGNILNLDNQIEKVMDKAAGYERRGTKVPEDLLSLLSDLRAEVEIANELLESRKHEKTEVAQRYDDDLLDYKRGEELEKQSDAATN